MNQLCIISQKKENLSSVKTSTKAEGVAAKQ
jgi:hypothetical protein